MASAGSSAAASTAGEPMDVNGTAGAHASAGAGGLSGGAGGHASGGGGGASGGGGGTGSGGAASDSNGGGASTAKPEPPEPPDLDKNPILQQWEWNSDGSLSGRVYGKKGYKQGEAMNTSVVPEDTRYSTYVVTGSGSIYRLGEMLIKEPKEARLKGEGATAAREGRERGAAAAARVKMTATAVGTKEEKAPGDEKPAKDSKSSLPPSEPPTPTGDGSDMRSPTRERKRSLPAAAEASPAPVEDPPKKPKHPNQYTKAAAAAAAAKAAAAGGGGSSSGGGSSGSKIPGASPRSSGALSDPNRPKHPNQYTKMHAAAAAAAAAQQQQQGGSIHGDGPPRPKQPNQYTYRNMHGGAPGSGSSTGKPKQPNQYTYRNMHTDGPPRPKQPNQYTARNAERAAAAAADGGGAPASPMVPPNPNAYFLGVSRLGTEWSARLVRSDSEDLLGTYATAKAAADAVAEMHAMLVKGGGKLPAAFDPSATPLPTSRAAHPPPSPASATAPLSAAPAPAQTQPPMPPPPTPPVPQPQQPLPPSRGPQRSPAMRTPSAGSTRIRVKLEDTADSTWIASPVHGGYELVARQQNGLSSAGGAPSQPAGSVKAADSSAAVGGEAAPVPPLMPAAATSSDGAASADGALNSPTRASSRSAAHAATALLAGIYNQVAGGGVKGSEASAAGDSRHGGMWIRCETCLKWRRLFGPELVAQQALGDRWVCPPASADDPNSGCEAPQERSSHPSIDLRLNLFDDESKREKAGRELRPLRPPKQSEDVPRDVLRARLPGDGGKRPRGEGGGGPAHRAPSSGGKLSRAQQRSGQQYLSNFSLGHTSTRIAVHEDGIWRFQPAVGEQYQIEVDPEPTCPTADACRKRADVCVWSPERAAAEGINVETYLLASQKLFAVARQAKSFSSEIALHLLYSHAFDVLAATHSMATAIGVDKLLEPQAPVVATTSIVRGRNGLRVALNLTLRHLAPSISRGQPQGSSGYVRSTRSKTTTLDFTGNRGEPWSPDEEEMLLDGMRQLGKDLASIRRTLLTHRPINQIVDFFYSARGQQLKFIAMKEREAAERKAQAAAERAAGLGKLPAGMRPGSSKDDNDDSAKRKRKLLALEAAGKQPPQRSRNRAADGKLSKRFGPRVFANVSVRGAHAEVRLRLRVKRVDLRRWGEAEPEVVEPAAAEAAAIVPAGSRPVKHIAARCRVLGSGRVKLNLHLKCVGGGAGRPPRQPRPRRPKEQPVAAEDDDDDDRASEMICTWLQCDRCSKWRIVPDNTAGSEGDNLWYCEMNPDPRHNRCEVPQQPDDAVVDFSGLLGSSSSSGGKAQSAKASGASERGRGRPPGSGNGTANGKRKATPAATAKACLPAGAAAAPGGVAAAGAAGAAASGAAPGGAVAATAPPRKRSNTGAARARTKGVELKRAHPPASAFAATVAAHAAQTAKLAADPNSFVPQAVAPLFACVVMPPGGAHPAMPPPMQAASAAQVASSLGLVNAPPHAAADGQPHPPPHGLLGAPMSGPMLVSAAPPRAPAGAKRVREDGTTDGVVKVAAPRVAQSTHTLVPGNLGVSTAPQRAAPMTASAIVPSGAVPTVAPTVVKTVVAPSSKTATPSTVAPSAMPAALQQPPSTLQPPQAAAAAPTTTATQPADTSADAAGGVKSAAASLVLPPMVPAGRPAVSQPVSTWAPARSNAAPTAASVVAPAVAQVAPAAVAAALAAAAAEAPLTISTDTPASADGPPQPSTPPMPTPPQPAAAATAVLPPLPAAAMAGTATDAASAAAAAVADAAAAAAAAAAGAAGGSGSKGNPPAAGPGGRAVVPL